VVTKRVRITRGVSTVTKDIVYTYDGEGKLASTKYPDEAKPWVMGYDAMARPSGLTQEWWDGNNNQWVNRQWVNGVSYGNAGQLLGMSTFSGIQNFAEVRFTETREYNERLQMTRQRTLQGATLAMDLRYVFTNGANPNNDGRIIQRENVLSGETVSYAYDSLQRLVNAETTSTAWGLSFDYDGFGNRWEQLVMKGTAPGNVVSFNQATNRINSSSYSHDANGNMLATPTVSGMTYDVENRLLTANGNGSLEEFAYLGDNKRVWKKATQGGTPVEQYYLYGVGGQRIATYSAVYSGGTLTLTYASKDVFFGGRVIWQNEKAVVQDRLGSVMARGNGTGGLETHDYFPYGEERTATVGDRNKFGTYHRDQTGLDYADQRYYNSAIGRFLTSDPYEASGRQTGPRSWNRGVYVVGDPVNHTDRRGLESEGPTWCPYTDRMERLEDCEDFTPGPRDDGPPTSEEDNITAPPPFSCPVEGGGSGSSDFNVGGFLGSEEMSADDLFDMLNWSPANPQDDGKDASSQREILLAYAAAAGTAYLWTAYVATSPTGQRYIGITLDFGARRIAHGARFVEMLQLGHLGKMNYATAKGVEQGLIEAARRAGISLSNSINSISPRSAYYNEFMGFGKNWINKCGKHDSFDDILRNVF
jgi:RHS repeat-associated protein